MISLAGIAEAVNMNKKGVRINNAAMTRNTQTKVSIIKCLMAFFFFLFRYGNMIIVLLNS
jgi:hypothetical protein